VCVCVCVFCFFPIELAEYVKQYRQLHGVTIKSVTDSISLQIVLV
jgi:hypothetical protein